jgi:hypothetical protein
MLAYLFYFGSDHGLEVSDAAFREEGVESTAANIMQLRVNGGKCGVWNAESIAMRVVFGELDYRRR